jgi:hypothetical protein
MELQPMFRRRWLTVLLVAGLGTVAGCGGNEPVKGVVKLDGTPVEGATVTFVSEDGKATFSGTTDAAGEFTLAGTDGKAGAKPGTYKVMVTKMSANAEPMAPPNPGDMKEAKAEMMEGAKEAAKPKAGGPRRPMGPGGMMGGGMISPGVRTELPVVYASTETTPIKVTVPSGQPIAIDLKSK